MLHTRRPIALVTGASGGMGRAVARRLGGTMDLILTDIASGPLEELSTGLASDGYTVTATAAGDLADDAVLSKLTDAVRARDGIDALVHTAGLSPVQADWRKILGVNVLATQRLLDAVESVLRPGATGILIASMAGHVDPGLGEADTLLDRPLDDAVIDALEPFLFGAGKGGGDAEAMASQLAYVLSKRAVIRLAEQRAGAWGKSGARIVSVSPGLIHTPMGVKEAEASPHTKATIEAQPVSRWGTAMDIASAVEFLVGAEAGFITGCDLRVDGGASLLAKAQEGQRAL